MPARGATSPVAGGPATDRPDPVPSAGCRHLAGDVGAGPRRRGRRPGFGGAGVRRAAPRLARPADGPGRRVHPRRARPVGHVLDLPLRPCRRGVPAAQSLDARVRHDPLRLAAVPGAAPRPRARRAARDELVWREDLVRRRDDPRDRCRDRHAGPPDRGRRRRRERRARGPDAAGLSSAWLPTWRSCCPARSASCPARRASEYVSPAPSPGCSACSSGRSSCSASTGRCRISGRSCRSDSAP